jgi:ArsR family transcriptional regulator
MTTPATALKTVPATAQKTAQKTAPATAREIPPPAGCCPPLLQQPITAAEAAGLARRLKALADPSRLQLVSLIAAHQGGEACVCELTGVLGLSQPTISHHLKVLIEAGLLSRDKRGVWAYYRLVPGALDALASLLTAPP